MCAGGIPNQAAATRPRDQSEAVGALGVCYTESARFKRGRKSCGTKSLLDDRVDAAMPVMSAADSVAAQRVDRQTVCWLAADADVLLIDGAAQAKSHCNAQLSWIKMETHRS